MKKNTSTKTGPALKHPDDFQPIIRNFSSLANWKKEAVRLFGEDSMKWAFICPSFGHIATVQEWKDVGASTGQIAFSCVGRYLPKSHEAFQGGRSPCNYAGGGLIRLNPVTVKEGKHSNQFFDFAPIT